MSPRKLFGIVLLSLPFIAMALLPLYTDAQWWMVGIGLGAGVGIIGLVFAAVKLLCD